MATVYQQRKGCTILARTRRLRHRLCRQHRRPSRHDIILKGIQILINLTHRGACGCDPETGDGAGILIQIPHQFFARECAKLGFTLPAPGEYGVGMVFLPVEQHARLRAKASWSASCARKGSPCWAGAIRRSNGSAIGRVARASQPYIEQIFIGRAPGMEQDAFERKLYVVRKRAENEDRRRPTCQDKGFFYIPSLSSRTIVYKGLLLAPQIANFYQRTVATRRCSARCAWCTSASRPTRSRPGNWRIRSATCATTARSTRCAAT